MKSVKSFFALVFGILGAMILAPFVAFFGLMMLGLAFGLSLIAAGAVTAMAKNATSEETKTPKPQACDTDDTSGDVQTA